MAGYETKSHTIDSVQYDVTLLGAKVASKVLLKLMKSVAPVFMAAALGRGIIDISRASDAIKSLSEDDFDWVVERFAANTVVHIDSTRAPSLGAPGVYDMHFSGRYSQMLEWLECCVEDNFGSFFADLKQRLPQSRAAAAPAPSPSTSPST